jgi:hypothetical protein
MRVRIQPSRQVQAAIVTVAVAAVWGAAPAVYSETRGHVRATSVTLERWLDRAEDTPLTSYRALRRLSATARDGKMRASMFVWTELDAAGGFRYSIVSEEGSENVRRRVFRAMLEGERDAESKGEPRSCAVGPTNYEFEPEVDMVDGLLRIAVHARREHPMLINGAVFFRPDDGDLVRVEGRLAKRPSFWTRRVDIVRSYARIAGVHVPVALHSKAQVLFFGEGTLTMTWQYERINGVTVGAPNLLAMSQDD